MKYLLIILTVFLFYSCGPHKKTREYRYASDGLIYKFGSTQLYTGKITDTSNVIIQFEVVNGVKHGKFVTHYLNGNIEKTGNINNNLNEGTWYYYYADGKIESIGKFKKNKPEGLWKSFYKDGKLKSIGKYREGIQDGYWYNYDSRGKVIGYYFYRDGRAKNLLFKTI